MPTGQFPRGKGCKMADNISLAQKPPKGYFVRRAKGSSKSSFFLRRNPYHPLWWDVADSAFLQKDRPQETLARLRSLHPEKSRLPSFRTHSRSHLRHHHRAPAHQQDRDPAVQRGLAGNVGAFALPRSIQLAAISEKSYSKIDRSPLFFFYKPRAAVEKNIREFLYDCPLGKIPTDSWTANVAFFQILLFAADIVHWFKRLCLPPDYLTTTLDTIRTDFLVLPARLVREHKKNVVKLPNDYHYQKEFLAATKKIEELELPENFRLSTDPPSKP